MTQNPYDQSFWNNLWLEGDTGWDIGYPAPALIDYCKQYVDKDQRLLIPGAGNAYEAEWLHENGFSNVTVIDIAPEAISNFHKRVPSFPKDNLVNANFFEHSGTYDVILEQTFFCALDPSLRPEYAEKMHELLATGGRLAGVLFNIERPDDKPPFGGNEQEYRQLFGPHFHILRMEPNEKSIKPREGRELFFELERP